MNSVFFFCCPFWKVFTAAVLTWCLFQVKADSPHWWAETATPVLRWWPADFCWQPVGSVCCSAPDPTGSSPDAPLHSLPGCLHMAQHKPTQHNRCKCDKCFVQKCTIALDLNELFAFSKDVLLLVVVTLNKKCYCVLFVCMRCNFFHCFLSVKSCPVSSWMINNE